MVFDIGYKMTDLVLYGGNRKKKAHWENTSGTCMTLSWSLKRAGQDCLVWLVHLEHEGVARNVAKVCVLVDMYIFVGVFFIFL